MRVIPPITFTDGAFARTGANATYWGSDGLLKTAAANAARFSYVPSDTTLPPYLLLETAAATNLFLYSRDGTQTAWTKTDTTASLTQTGIDGAANSATLYTQGSAGTGQVVQSATVAAGAVVACDVFVKRSNTDWLCLYLTGPAQTNGMQVWFNTATGSTSGLAQRGAGTQQTATVVQVSGGFWWLQLSCKPDASYTSAQLTMMAVTGAGVTTRATGGAYIADYAKLEAGAATSFPILTTTASATRAADMVATAAPWYVSPIPDPDTSPGIAEQAWVSGTTYAAGDKRVDGHRLYLRKTAGAGSTVPKSDPTNWEDIGPSNRQAMFDLNRNAATQSASSFSVALAPGRRINSLALVGLQASAVQVDMHVGSTLYYRKTIKTVRRFTTGWLSWLTGAWRYAPTVMLMDLPIVSGAVITITFVGTGIKCAAAVVGTFVDCGTAQLPATDSALNFSKIDRDAFGNTNMVPRRSVPVVELKTIIPRANVNSLRQTRKDLNAVPALWSGLDASTSHDYFEAYLIFGPYKQFDLSMDSGVYTTVSFKLEEL